MIEEQRKRDEIYETTLYSSITALKSAVSKLGKTKTNKLYIKQLKVYKQMKKDALFAFNTKITWSKKKNYQLLTLLTECMDARKTSNNMDTDDVGVDDLNLRQNIINNSGVDSNSELSGDIDSNSELQINENQSVVNFPAIPVNNLRRFSRIRKQTRSNLVDISDNEIDKGKTTVIEAKYCFFNML